MPDEPRALVCHRATPTDAVRSVQVSVERPSPDTLALAFRLDATMERIRVPPPAPARLTMQLWEHTCFEAFVSTDDDPAYHEYNLAPSGAWAAFAFARYRQVAALADQSHAPTIRTDAAADTLRLDARLPLGRLAARYVGAPLRLALAAVIEESDGRLSYWALHHPPGKPDFHHADAFALRLS